MIRKISKNEIRERVHIRIRKKLRGTTERPRLTVFRSTAHIYAQVIDDTKGVTLVAASSTEKVQAARRPRAAMWRRRRKSANAWPSAPKRTASTKWCSIVAAISIMAA